MATQNQLDQIKKISAYDQVSRYLRYKNLFNFTAGDFLIKECKIRDSWKVETISDASSVPKRYKCIHEDSYGVKFIVALTADGTESATIIPVTEINEYSRMIVDPSYAEHIILCGDEEYDPGAEKKQEKARRDKITRLNKKLAIFITTEADLAQLVPKLQVGTKLRYGWNIPTAVMCQELTITELFQKDGDAYYKVNNQMYGNRLEHLRGSIVFLVEPHSYEAI